MTVTTDFTVSTGDYIAEWMESEGINAAELSRRLGVSRKHVSELLNGKATLSQKTALALERVTGVPARIWNLYEIGYRNDLAQMEATASLEAQYERAKAFPLAYLRRHGHIGQERAKASVVQGLLRFFGVASLDAFDDTWSAGAVAYRKRAASRDDTPALATWLRLAERDPDRLASLPPFDERRLTELLPQLRTLTLAEPRQGLREAIELLESAGVALSIHPAIRGLGIHGVTRWVDAHPVIQLSCLMKSDDQVWFTLFHELGHVLLHSHKGLWVFGEKSVEEDEANCYAAELLVPPEAVPDLPTGRDLDAVRDLASRLGVAPSIVLGQAQRRSHDFAWGHALKRAIDWDSETHEPI